MIALEALTTSAPTVPVARTFPCIILDAGHRDRAPWTTGLIRLATALLHMRVEVPGRPCSPAVVNRSAAKGARQDVETA